MSCHKKQKTSDRAIITVKSKNPPPHGTTYRGESIIGQGSFGIVYKARDISKPDSFVALKQLEVSAKHGVPSVILREIGIAKKLSKYSHPNVVKLLEVFMIKSEPMYRVFLVLEFMEVDLYTHIRSRTEAFTHLQIREMSFNILCGIHFLHVNCILHRDLKPQNLLVTSKGIVKLADFGLSKVFDASCSSLTPEVVTLWYRPPEVLLGSSYGFAIDIWSFAAVVVEIQNLEPIFPGLSEKDQLDKIFDVIGTPSEDEWPADSPLLSRSFTQRPPRLLETLIPGISLEMLDLLKKLLVFNPVKRLTAWDVVKHPYYSGLTLPVLSPPK